MNTNYEKIKNEIEEISIEYVEGLRNYLLKNSSADAKYIEIILACQLLDDSLGYYPKYFNQCSIDISALLDCSYNYNVSDDYRCYVNSLMGCLKNLIPEDTLKELSSKESIYKFSLFMQRLDELVNERIVKKLN